MKKETRWKPSQAIDAHRIAIGDLEYGKGEMPGPDLGAFKRIGSLDCVPDLNLFWQRSAKNLSSKGLPVTIQAVVRSITYLTPEGIPRSANGVDTRPVNRVSLEDEAAKRGMTVDEVKAQYAREAGARRKVLA